MHEKVTSDRSRRFYRHQAAHSAGIELVIKQGEAHRRSNVFRLEEGVGISVGPPITIADAN